MDSAVNTLVVAETTGAILPRRISQGLKTRSRRKSGTLETAYRGLRVANPAYRFYNPGLGRWASRDPIGEFGGPNTYLSCGNSLLQRHDALGLQDLDELRRAADPVYRVTALGIAISYGYSGPAGALTLAESRARAIRLAFVATGDQSVMEDYLFRQLRSACPRMGETVTLLPYKEGLPSYGWHSSHCCTRESCVEQARKYAHEATYFARMVALAEETRRGRVIGDDPYPPGRPGADEPLASWQQGSGLRCGAWLSHMQEIYDAVFKPYASKGKLCFRSMQVSIRGFLTIGEHEWLRIVGGSGAQPPPKMDAPGWNIDPWVSGGRQVLPPLGRDYEPEHLNTISEW